LVFDEVGMKKIRRRVLIRESDYCKIVTNAVGGIIFDGMMLYTHSEFEPLTQIKIEQEETWAILQNRRHVWQYASRGVKNIFFGMKDYLYNPRYADWQSFWDDEGYLCVQARSNTPVSRVGWATFEYNPYL
jgi:hypothetical protein